MSTKEQEKFSKQLDDAENTARIRMFGKASKKYEGLIRKAEELEPSMVEGLRFLSTLYRVNADIADKKDPVETGSLQHLNNMGESISNQSLSMALPGGVFGEIDTGRILSEVKAILLMDKGMLGGYDEMFKEAIQLFLEIGHDELYFSRYVRPLKRRINGRRAALECEARSQILKGEVFADPYPNAAIPYFMIATRALRAARKYDEESTVRATLIGLKMVRRCWFCGRLVQGANHFVSLDSSVTEYFQHLLRENKEDLRVHDGDSISACVPCATALNKEADRVARFYHDVLLQELNKLRSEVQHLQTTVARLGGV